METRLDLGYRSKQSRTNQPARTAIVERSDLEPRPMETAIKTSNPHPRLWQAHETIRIKPMIFEFCPDLSHWVKPDSNLPITQRTQPEEEEQIQQATWRESTRLKPEPDNPWWTQEPSNQSTLDNTSAPFPRWYGHEGGGEAQFQDSTKMREARCRLARQDDLWYEII
jgi:hypothetical protein